MVEGLHRSRYARPTVVLLAVAIVALLVALVLREAPAEPTSSAPADGETGLAGIEPELMAAALDRVAAIDQPLTVWLRLADCESGEWNAEATPVPGTARWTYGATKDTRFEGGLHFEPSTWDAHRDPVMPDHAGDATPVAQMVVAERVLDEQGWRAWPVCSEKLGLR